MKPKRKRVFNGHAKCWKYGMKSLEPGELVQVDHATILLDSGDVVKHFTAICPFTKYASFQVYTQATSNLAAKFVEHVEKTFPFKIKSFQVDGGSEFEGDFEQTCKTKDFDLYVLPPRSPKLNGTVERGNATAKYEFYYQYCGPSTLGILQAKLKEFNVFYNEIRPHQGLHYLTPEAYYKSGEVV